MKKGFTLIELILVIVIMAILALFAINIYTNVYTNYIYARTINELEANTENVIEQISSRLSNRIPEATIGRTDLNEDDIVIMDMVDERYKILEWLGKSISTQKIGAKEKLGWSGFVDLEKSTDTNLITPGSNLQLAKNNITNPENMGIFFVDGNGEHSADGFGFKDDTHNKIAIANLNTSTDNNMTINTVGYTGKISQRYYLINSAYALVPSKPKDYNYTYKGKKMKFSDFDLDLYYNFRPWLGQTLSNADHITLARHVTLFRFRGDYGSIDLKICLRSDKIPSTDFVVCKTKVIE